MIYRGKTDPGATQTPEWVLQVMKASIDVMDSSHPVAWVPVDDEDGGWACLIHPMLIKNLKGEEDFGVLEVDVAKLLELLDQEPKPEVLCNDSGIFVEGRFATQKLHLDILWGPPEWAEVMAEENTDGTYSFFDAVEDVDPLLN